MCAGGLQQVLLKEALTLVPFSEATDNKNPGARSCLYALFQVRALVLLQGKDLTLLC